jgi:hypothetical protein
MEAGAAEKRITYRFRFDDGREVGHTVRLDPETLAIADPLREDPPDWTRLEFRQCRNCPLDPARHAHCPIAVRAVGLIESFRDAVSFEPTTVTVETDQRTYLHRTSLQRGLSAVLGIYMVASGCPIMNRLRPMVDTHLPFASTSETTYRTVSMYLMAQFFRKRSGEEPDFELRRFPEMLEAVREVDVGFSDRLGAIGIGDASLNALVILTTFGDHATLAVLCEDLERWERLFREHCG